MTVRRLPRSVLIVAAWLVIGLAPVSARIGGDGETRIRANETAAIMTLREILSAEVRFQAGAHVDENDDGIGEFGTLAELAGARSLRGRKALLDPPLLPGALLGIEADGAFRSSGYRFRVWLPGAGGVALGEGRRLATKRADARLAAVWFVIQAWPEDHGRTGRRTFAVTRTGDVFATRRAYSGDREPEADAALTPMVTPDVSILGDPVPGERACDGLCWDAFEAVPDSDPSSDPDRDEAISRRRRLANEVAAIATVRNVCAAQAQFQVAAIVDVDNDGTGEYGTFAEMSGAIPVRGNKTRITSPVLPAAFQKRSQDETVRRWGYRFAIYLPGEKGLGTSDARPEPDLAETAWVGYAWPEEHGRTGNRTFIVLAGGDILAVNAARYSGDAGPSACAAMPPGEAMPATIDRPAATDGPAADGSRWKLEP